MKHKRIIAILLAIITFYCSFSNGNQMIHAAQTYKWVVEANTPIQITAHKTVAIGDKLYIMGGQNNRSQIQNGVYIYDTLTSTWSTGASMPTPKMFFGTAVINDNIYVMGGAVNGSTIGSNQLEIYDSRTNTWSSGAPMPYYGQALQAVTYGTKIYVIGGTPNNYSSYVPNIQIYDTVTNTWSIGSDLPNVGVDSAVQIFEDSIYILGGLRNGVSVDEVHIYNIATDTWATGSPMPSCRNFGSSVIYGHKIYVFGGYITHDPFSSYVDYRTVEVYDIFNDTWEKTIPDLSAPNRHSTATLIDNTVYLVGGMSGSTTMYNTVETFALPEEKLSILLYVGESTQLSVSDDLSINSTLNWSSTSQNIASVNSNGVVTAQDLGTCYIILRDANNNFLDYMSIKVVEDGTYRLAVDLKVGQKSKLYLIPNPLNVNWSSLNTSIATVSNTGEVTALKKGLTIINGEYKGKIYQIYVRVRP